MQQLEKILNIVSDYFEILKQDVKGKSRKSEYRLPRQIFHYFAKKYTKKTFEKIGEITNNEYSSVIHSCKVINNYIFTNDSEINTIVNDLTTILNRKLKQKSSTYYLKEFRRIFEILQNCS